MHYNNHTQPLIINYKNGIALIKAETHRLKYIFKVTS